MCQSGHSGPEAEKYCCSRSLQPLDLTDVVGVVLADAARLRLQGRLVGGRLEVGVALAAGAALRRQELAAGLEQLSNDLALEISGGERKKKMEGEM